VPTNRQNTLFTILFSGVLSMETIYVMETGAYLRREGNAIRIMKGHRQVDRIPAQGLKKLILVGYVSLSSGVLDFLIKNRVETVFMTPSGRFRARLMPDEHRHVALRRSQYIKLDRPEFALQAARSIVGGKLANMTRMLLKRGRQYKEEGLLKAAARLRSIEINLAQTTNMDMLRGMEGLSARIYFSVFPLLIRNSDFIFKGRNRRPPRDPVNALLSFIYTLLTNEVLSAIKAWGLDPYMGSLHEISYGRPSLACDLVEEYRAFLGDRFVLGLINRKVIRADDFVFRPNAPSSYRDEEEMKSRRPVLMKPAVGRTFINAYEAMMARTIHCPEPDKKLSYRRLILHQVRSFGKYLTDDEPYMPFKWEG